MSSGATGYFLRNIRFTVLGTNLGRAIFWASFSLARNAKVMNSISLLVTTRVKVDLCLALLRSRPSLKDFSYFVYYPVLECSELVDSIKTFISYS